MINRIIEKELEITAQEYPIVTIIGPRQSGKTTLAKKKFPDYTYANLENPEIRNLADSDPKSFFKQYPTPLIIDEVENVPELLSWIQVKTDENSKQKAQFILTGSHQLKLREAISQSLAGRTAILTLMPFSHSELDEEYTKNDRCELILNGFMPRVHDQKIRPQRFYRDYYQTYVERDVRRLLAIENQQSFELFLRLLAGRTGQEINYSSLGNQVGISVTQIKKWVSILEASFLIFRLPPFFKNYGKRLTKSSKIYFTEVGLVIYLLGIETAAQLDRDPLFGNIFENMVIAEAYKTRLNAGKNPGLYFFRDNHQKEIDLLYPIGPDYIPIEIKSSRTYKEDLLKNLKYYRKLSETETPGVLLYDGDLEIDNHDTIVTNFRNYF